MSNGLLGLGYGPEQLNTTMRQRREFSQSNRLITPKGFQPFANSVISGSVVPEQEARPISRQWPWRALAFLSDLGTLGYLIQQPKLGGWGWLAALPYYYASLFSQPAGPQRNEELIFQATANGLFPLIAAKIGISFVHVLERLTVIPPKWLAHSQKTLPLAKITGGIVAMAVLTMTVGDPITQWILTHYKKSMMFKK